MKPAFWFWLPGRSPFRRGDLSIPGTLDVVPNQCGNGRCRVSARYDHAAATGRRRTTPVGAACTTTTFGIDYAIDRDGNGGFDEMTKEGSRYVRAAAAGWVLAVVDGHSDFSCLRYPHKCSRSTPPTTSSSGTTGIRRTERSRGRPSTGTSRTGRWPRPD